MDTGIIGYDFGLIVGNGKGEVLGELSLVGDGNGVVSGGKE